jgi:8-oxo-dGTP pyrophosphatase MutT (NUDIX family)
MRDRTGLQAALQAYHSSFAEELPYKALFLELLQQAGCFERTHLPGHITGSAWIVSPDRTQVLLVHHGKLNRWMQPGGHADGEEDVLNVALREAEEETGVQNPTVIGGIFDMDIHTIPARKDFPEHLHYDLRFLMEADPAKKITVSEESHDVKWVPLDKLEEYTQERSVLRMKEKLIGER